MGTSAFDRVWDAPTSGPGDALDALWDHPVMDAAAKLHAEYASGRLAKRMARENENDQEAADAESVSLPRAALNAVTATGANIAQGIPGMEAAEAGARSLVRGQSYREALSDIQGQTSKIPTALRYGERVAGAVPLASVLPGSATVSGALVGGADELLNADPDIGVTGRAIRAPIGALTGAVLGNLGEKAGVYARSFLPKSLGGVGEGADAAVIRMNKERAASAGRLFNAALSEGRGAEVSPQIHDFLQEDDIAPIVADIRSSREGATLDTPELLDRVYKELSQRERVAQRALQQAEPTRSNAAVTALKNASAAKNRFMDVVTRPGRKAPLTLDVAPEVFETEPNVVPGHEALNGPVSGQPLAATTTPPNPTLSQAVRNFQGNTPNAMQGPGGPAFQLRAKPEQVTPGVRIETPGMRVQTAPAEDVPALMPSYKEAVQDYAKRSNEIKALKRGYAALYSERSGRMTPPNALGKKTPLAFADWIKTASPEEIQAARAGILGGVRDQLPKSGLTLKQLRRVGGAAPKLLRAVPSQQQDLNEILQNLGLLTAGNAVTSP